MLISIEVLFVPASSHADRPRHSAPPFTPMWASPQLRAEPLGRGIVRIEGATFHKNVRAYYGDIPMQILEVDKRYIIAVLPRRVRLDNFIYVTDSTGRARTIEPFDHPRHYRHWQWSPPRYKPR